jgi:hypothetical protein
MEYAEALVRLTAAVVARSDSKTLTAQKVVDQAEEVLEEIIRRLNARSRKRKLGIVRDVRDALSKELKNVDFSTR